MPYEHPFSLLFESLARVPTSHAKSVNRLARTELLETLSVPADHQGRCILLKAPRAGHGKTHLIAKVQQELAATHEFIHLRASSGTTINATSVTEDTLRRLSRQLPAAGGLCELDLIARRLFALALQPLVASGEVPCQDREGAISVLRTRPTETLDFHHPNAITAQWTKENFEILGHRFSIELCTQAHLPLSGVSFWLNIFFRFACAPLEAPTRVHIVTEALRNSHGVPMEILECLLGLVSLVNRVVLVADDLEGFSTDENAALRLSAFLGTLREAVGRLDAIFSINEDVWTSAFLPRLSGGLTDRMSEVVIELEPLKELEMIDLLDSRLPGLGHRILEQIDVSASGTHARGLVRAAGVAWLRALAHDQMRGGIEVPREASEQSKPELEEPTARVIPAFIAGFFPPVTEERPLAASIPQHWQEADTASHVEKGEPEPAETPISPFLRPQPTQPFTSEPPTDGDRIDELLRQFRERYGKAGL